jgi:hypothetical protein
MLSHPKRANIGGPSCRPGLLWRMRSQVCKKTLLLFSEFSYTVRPPAVSDFYSIEDIVLIFIYTRAIFIASARAV